MGVLSKPCGDPEAGSYPRFEEKTFQTLLTLESRDPSYVQRALDALLARLPGDAIHKVE